MPRIERAGVQECRARDESPNLLSELSVKVVAVWHRFVELVGSQWVAFYDKVIVPLFGLEKAEKPAAVFRERRQGNVVHVHPPVNMGGTLEIAPPSSRVASAEPSRVVVPMPQVGMAPPIAFPDPRFQSVSAAAVRGVMEGSGYDRLFDFESLQCEGVLPQHRLTLDGVTYYCSPYFLNGNHVHVVALVQLKGRIYSRIFYQSNSQATWRSMPYLRERKGRGVHYNKGIMESDTNLPIFVICAMTQLSSRGVEKGWGASVFKRWREVAKSRRGVYPNTISPHALLTFPRRGERRKIDAAVEVPIRKGDPLLPDFKRCFYEKKLFQSLYGDLTVRVYPSKNNVMLYMYSEAYDGKAFLSAFESPQVPISEYGVRSEVVFFEDGEPLMEYRTQIKKGRFPQLPSPPRYCESAEGRYENNWNSVRRSPLIRLYYQAHGRRMPERV